MSDVALAAQIMREVAPSGSPGQRILAVARKLRWKHGRTRDIWYEQARRIDAMEMDQLRAARDTRKLQEASHEYRELRARIARIEAVLLAQDEAFHGPALDALQQQVRGPRASDRSGA